MSRQFFRNETVANNNDQGGFPWNYLILLQILPCHHFYKIAACFMVIFGPSICWCHVDRRNSLSVPYSSSSSTSAHRVDCLLLLRIPSYSVPIPFTCSPFSQENLSLSLCLCILYSDKAVHLNNTLSTYFSKNLQEHKCYCRKSLLVNSVRILNQIYIILQNIMSIYSWKDLKKWPSRKHTK